MEVNTKLVPDGSNVTVSIPSVKINPQNPVSGGKFITTITDLNPETAYTYTITFLRRNAGSIIDQPIYGQFTTRVSESKGLFYTTCPVA